MRVVCSIRHHQDQNEYQPRCWSTNGEYDNTTKTVTGAQMPARKKGAGAGEHISLYVDSIRGRGFELTDAEVEAVNMQLEHEGQPKLEDSKTLMKNFPGIEFLKIGGDSWWRYDDFERQFNRVVTAFKVCYSGTGTLPKPALEKEAAVSITGPCGSNFSFTHPGEPDVEWQLNLVVDHSQNHLKFEDGALFAHHFNTGYGGKQPTPRDTKVEHVGPGATLAVGETQTGAFVPGVPPIGNPSCLQNDEPQWEDDAQKVPKMDKRRKPAVQQVKEGYVGKAKGLEQLLRERGLYRAGMTKDGFFTRNGVKTYKGDEFNMQLVLNSQPDYQKELTALQTLGAKLGVIVDASTKCHPEIAGEGVEYVFAFLKQITRSTTISSGKRCRIGSRSHLHVL